MGLRPDLLGRSLNSLAPLLPHLTIIAVNDFGDDATNQVFADICPHGERINLGGRVGHHRAVDAMYGRVQTPFVFHIEDDWQFSRTDFLTDAKALLCSDSRFSSVCLRNVADIPSIAAGIGDYIDATMAAPAHVRLDSLHDKWHGFTFNPHLAKLDVWKRIGPFSNFKIEKHISRLLRAQGHFVAYLEPGACQHIGDARRVSVPQQPLLRQFKNWIRTKPKQESSIE